MRTATNNKRARVHAEPMELLLDDIAAIKRDISGLINGSVDALGKRARQLTDQTCETAEAAHERLAAAVNNKPVRTIVIAAAAGFAGAKLLHWMSRR